MSYNLLKNVGKRLSFSSFPEHVFHPHSRTAMEFHQQPLKKDDFFSFFLKFLYCLGARNLVLDASVSYFLVKTIPISQTPVLQPTMSLN